MYIIFNGTFSKNFREVRYIFTNIYIAWRKWDGREKKNACIYIVCTICYNKSMNSIIKFYELHSVTGLTFRFKLDLNPVTKEYEPHIWHRHQVEPENVVTAFLNISYTSYNKIHNRYESYSLVDDLYIWYNYYSPDKTKIMIITAFKI